MAIKNIAAFDRWIIAQTKNINEEQIPLFVKRVALEIFRRVIMKSPVGNPSLWANPASAPPGYVGGRFRSNWQIDTKLNNDSTMETGGNTGSALGVAAMSNKTIASGGTIWIFNNVPYAKRLEQGWSSQAPAGVVGVTLLEVSQAAL